MMPANTSNQAQFDGARPDDDDEEIGTFASPPCFMHELQPLPMSNDEILRLLNLLLEGERAGVQAVSELRAAARDPQQR